MNIVEAMRIDLFGIARPQDIVVDDRGDFYVSDEFNHRVLKYSSSGEHLWTVGQLGSGLGDLHYPCGMALQNGNLYVADSWNKRIHVFNLDGSALACLGDWPEFKLLHPEDIKLGPDGMLWILDSELQCILRFDSASGALLSVFSGEIDPKSEASGEGILFKNLGSSLKYPRQLCFAMGKAVVRDNEKITLVGLGLCDDLCLPLNQPGAILLGTYDSKALVYAKQTGAVSLFCLDDLSFSPFFRFTDIPSSVLVRDHKLWCFYEDRLRIIVLPPRIDGTLDGGFSPLIQWDQSLFAARETSIAQPLDFDQLLFPLQEFKRMVEIFCAGGLYFKGKGPTPLMDTQPAEHRLGLQFLTEKGQELVQYFETLMLKQGQDQFQQQIRLRAQLESLDSEGRLETCSKIASAYLNYFAELQSYKEELCGILEAVLRGGMSPETATKIRQVDGCMFYIARLLGQGLESLNQFNRCLDWLGVREALAREGITGFFAATVSHDVSAFDGHLRNCLNLWRPERFPCYASALQVFEEISWALEGLVFTGLHRAHGHQSTETYDAHYCGYLVWIHHSQVFRHEGRLHKAFGFPFDLQNLLSLLFWFGKVEMSEALVKRCRNEPFWSDIHTQIQVAYYKLYLPDWGDGLSLLEKACARLVDESQAHGFLGSPTQKANVLALTAYYSSLKLQAAQNTWFESIEGHSTCDVVRVNLFREWGRFDEAIAICKGGMEKNWQLSMALAEIYVCHKRWEAAIAILSAPSPDFPSTLARLNLAICYRMSHQFSRAEALFQELEHEGVQTIAYHRGIMLRLMGLEEKALTCFSSQKKVCPFMAVCKEELLTLRKMGRMEAYQLLLSELPDTAYLQWNGQRITKRFAQFTEVVDAFLKVETEYSNFEDKTFPIRASWVIQSQVMEPRLLFYQETRFSQLQKPWHGVMKGETW